MAATLVCGNAELTRRTNIDNETILTAVSSGLPPRFPRDPSLLLSQLAKYRYGNVPKLYRLCGFGIHYHRVGRDSTLNVLYFTFQCYRRSRGFSQKFVLGLLSSPPIRKTPLEFR